MQILLVLLTSVFSFDVDPSLLFTEVVGLIAFVWGVIKIYFKIKSKIENLETTVLENRKATVIESAKIKNELTAEISRVKKESDDHERLYSEGLVRITALIDNHSKTDEAKFSHILDSLGNLGSQMAVISNNIGFIIDGKLGNQNSDNNKQ